MKCEVLNIEEIITWLICSRGYTALTHSSALLKTIDSIITLKKFPPLWMVKMETIISTTLEIFHRYRAEMAMMTFTAMEIFQTYLEAMAKIKFSIPRISLA